MLHGWYLIRDGQKGKIARGRMPFPEVVRQVLATCGRYALLLALIEVSRVAGAGPSMDHSRAARAVLRTHCVGCHGEQAKPKSDLGYITDLQRMKEGGLVQPGAPGQSPLDQRVADGEMSRTGQVGQELRRRTRYLAAMDDQALGHWGYEVVDRGMPQCPNVPRSGLFGADSCLFQFGLRRDQ